ncbi:MAG: RluA family pseudouridine synthase, partial [Sinobacterium sp.]|nr:RluA family pseudouridine synthase [Sinobacterium sp.]
LEAAIVFESNDLIVINKPSGLAVHGGSGINTGLIEALRQMRPDSKRLELVHRLDKDTSGCTMIAKKSSVLRYLHQQLREKTIQKTYWALVKGRWPTRKNLVDLALEKNIVGSGERMVRPSPEGKASKTAFKVLEALKHSTLVEAKPITGRTHQIRVHAQASGYPIMGDVKYGIKEDVDWEKGVGLNRLFLHAAEIAFRLPDSDEVHVVKSPLPQDLQKVVLHLRES